MDIPSINPSDIRTAQMGASAENLRMMALNPDKKMNDKQMREVADQFEGMIFRQMLKEMRKTVPTEDGLFAESHAMQMYMDIVDDHLATQLTQQNNMGIDTLIYDELKQRQEKIMNPGEKDFGFMKLRNEHTQEEQEFIPLHTTTEKFLELHKPQRMMDLPTKEPFMPLGPKHRVSSGRISNL